MPETVPVHIIEVSRSLSDLEWIQLIIFFGSKLHTQKDEADHDLCVITAHPGSTTVEDEYAIMRQITQAGYTVGVSHGEIDFGVATLEEYGNPDLVPPYEPVKKKWLIGAKSSGLIVFSR